MFGAANINNNKEMQMGEIHTSKSLLRALEEGASRTPSFDQLEKQRLSFVMGSLPERNSMTREQVQSVLERQEGRKIAAG